MRLLTKIYLSLLLFLNAEVIHAINYETRSFTGLTADDKRVKILWRENTYNRELQDSMSMIVMDTSYCRTISDPEKAAIAYVATFVGNDCWWDGNATGERNNLKCRILTELNLGYQCSETHLGFLRQWFRDDAKALEKLDDCPTTPFTATVQETFDSISISAEGELLVLNYSVTGVNIRDELEWHRTVQITFRKTNNGLVIENEMKSD